MGTRSCGSTHIFTWTLSNRVANITNTHTGSINWIDEPFINLLYIFFPFFSYLQKANSIEDEANTKCGLCIVKAINEICFGNWLKRWILWHLMTSICFCNVHIYWYRNLLDLYFGCSTKLINQCGKRIQINKRNPFDVNPNATHYMYHVHF